MRHGHGTCTTAQVLIRVVKSLAPSNLHVHNRTWQGTVPETSAIVYGVWCTPTYSAMRGANST